jgi:hypothetical protein
MGHDMAKSPVFLPRHDRRRDLLEARHFHKKQRHLAPRLLRSNIDESPNTPLAGVRFAFCDDA